MRLQKKQKWSECRVSIAPLIDVVFLLIIFFMVVSQFSQVDAESLSLPGASEGESVGGRSQEKVIVNVHEDGKIVVGSIEYTITALGELLDDFGNEAMEVGVLIRADKGARAGAVRAVMKACADRGIRRVRVGVVEKERQN